MEPRRTNLKASDADIHTGFEQNRADDAGRLDQNQERG